MSKHNNIIMGRYLSSFLQNKLLYYTSMMDGRVCVKLLKLHKITNLVRIRHLAPIPINATVVF